MQKPRISIVAAIGKNRVLGKGNRLLWHIPDDLKRFKRLTEGHPVIMGRKTFESIVGYLGGPLPNRPNIIVTRQFDKLMAGDPAWSHESVVAVASIEDAIDRAKALDAEEVFVGGGAQIYELALPYANRLYLTEIDDEKEGDSFFPPYEDQFTKKTFDESHEWNGLRYRWVDLER